MEWQTDFSIGFRGDFVTFSIPSQYILIASIWLALALFGYLYNEIVSRKMREGYANDVWVFVVIGVAVTLCGAALRDPEAALWVLTCFGASGTWMILGAINRNVTRRRLSEQKARRAIIAALEEVKRDATP